MLRLPLAVVAWLGCGVVTAGCGKQSERPSTTGSATTTTIAPMSPLGANPGSGSALDSGSARGSGASATLVTVGALQLVMKAGPPLQYLIHDTAQSFEMRFPGKPELSPLPFATATGEVAGVQVFVETDGVAITLVRLPLPTAQGQPLDAAGLQVAYDGMRDQGAENLGGKVIENEDVKISGLPARRIGLRVQSQDQTVLQMQWLVYQPSQGALYMIGATYREADAARVVSIAKGLVAEVRVAP